MGSPFSAILSELYIQHYESKYLFNYNIYKQFIKTYFRYVDDIFISFKGTLIYI